MKTKIVGIFVCMLLIATALPSVGIMNVSNTKIVEENVDSDDQSNMWVKSKHMPVLTNEEYEEKRLEVDIEITNTRGWYYKPPYSNYAPSGMPDFSQKQDQWKCIFGGENGKADTPKKPNSDDIQVTPVGNSTQPMGVVIAPGPDCTLDTQPVPDDYAEFGFCGPVAVANCFWWFDSKYASPGTPGDGKDDFSLVEKYGTETDDHSFTNVPLLIKELAGYFNTCSNGGTKLSDMQDGIDQWFVDTGLDNFFERTTYNGPEFEFIESEIERSQDVILRIGFYNLLEDGTCDRIIGHYVTCAGVNSVVKKIAFSDPGRDQTPSQFSHNDAKYVSHDIYIVAEGCPCPNVNGNFWLPTYTSSYDYTIVDDAIVICPTNSPPNKPDKPSGPTSGKKGSSYSYTTKAIDPDNDKVKYGWDWTGNGEVDQWDDNGASYYPSGATVTTSHTWRTAFHSLPISSTYCVLVIAEDIKGAQSIWSDPLCVTMPRNKAIYRPFLNFLQQHPNAFPILRQLLGVVGR